MQDLRYILLSIAVMALTTYLIRVIPLVLFRKQIQNAFVQNFLYYVPYAVLSAMTIPAIFSSTASLPSAVGGFIIALIVSYFEIGTTTLELTHSGLKKIALSISE